jgi:hypothetical protein
VGKSVTKCRASDHDEITADDLISTSRINLRIIMTPDEIATAVTAIGKDPAALSATAV